MTSGTFERAVLNTPSFYDFCEANGYSINNVITSKQFEGDKEKFSISTISKNGLIDPQFDENIPKGSGIVKTVLPFSFVEGSAMVMVYAPPNTVVENHSHTKGFFRFVYLGEYTFTGLPGGEIRLMTGEWIYIPKNTTYGYRAGPYGGGGGCCYCTNRGR